jgi:DNA-directed RNA polymerase beta subunit
MNNPNFLKRPDVDDPSISNEDTIDIIRKFATSKSFASDHIESFNELVQTDINDVFMQSYKSLQRTVKYNHNATKTGRNSTDKNIGSNITTVKIEPQFSKVVVHPPQRIRRDTGTKEPMMPSFARMNSRNYVIPFTGTFKCTLTATEENGTKIVREETIEDVFIMSMPCSTKSDPCPLSKMSHDAQIAMGENPLHPGAIFTLSNEWIVNHQEGLQFCELRTFNNRHEGEATRSEMLSKLNNTNGNSAQFITRFMETHQLTITIDHIPFREYNFPFYVIFRLLGAETHHDIVDSILIGDNTSPRSMYIQALLKKQFFAKYKHFPNAHHNLSLDELKHHIIMFMGTDLNKGGTEVYMKNKNVWYTVLMDKIDKYFLPHMGQLPCNRIAKYKLLGWYIRYGFYVNMGVYPETDRDSELSKRNERSGKRLVKMFKTFINSTIATPLLNAYQHALEHIPFENINIKEIHDNAIDTSRLEKMFIKLIAGGTKKSIKTGNRGQTITSRLNTIQQSGGHLNTICSLRQIVATSLSATSKQSTREHEMRLPHPSAIGYKCPVRTQENENIGRTKEMSVCMFITSDISIPVFLNVLSDEYKTGVIVKNPSIEQITDNKMTKVTINWSGETVGWTTQPYLLTHKYRYFRRIGKIDKLIGINWKIAHDMLTFHCDGERGARPMVIVYNNYGDTYTQQFKQNKNDYSDFFQWSAVRKSHINKLRAGIITVDDLVTEGVMEYVTIAEHNNSYVAKSFVYLEENETNFKTPFHYVEMPASVYGMSALMGVNQNMNPGTRNTYSTNFARQAAGEHASNWRERKDKGLALQTYNEISPLHSIGNFLTITCGVVFTVDIALDPYNQEDSQTHSLAVRDSGKCIVQGLEVITTSLGNDEEFRLPPASNSTRRRNVNYSTVNASTGLPDNDTMLHKNDIAIAKVCKRVDKQLGETTYIDRSVRYTKMESGIVISTADFRNEDDIPTRSVIVAKMRMPELGDKYASRNGQKGVIGAQYAPNDMPFDQNGRIASLIFNPHGIPKRMTVGHMTEGTLATLYALKCISHDGTIHSPINLNDIPNKLKEAGLHEDGTSLLQNPHTGIVMKTRTYRGLIFYQNLQKFVLDKRYASASGSTDIITRQPLEGKSVDGGLRFGEMERDVALVIGATKFVSEKNYYHSNPATIYVCEKCGLVPAVTPNHGVSCKICLDNTRVYAVDTTWSSWVFLNEIGSMYKLRIELKDHEFADTAKKYVVE